MKSRKPLIEKYLDKHSDLTESDLADRIAEETDLSVKKSTIRRDIRRVKRIRQDRREHLREYRENIRALKEEIDYLLDRCEKEEEKRKAAEKEAERMESKVEDLENHIENLENEDSGFSVKSLLS